MTRGDFILGVISSLIATILFELTRKFYPRLPSIPIREFCRGFFKIFATNNVARVLPSFVLLTVAISILLSTSIPTAFAPTEELKINNSKYREAQRYYEEAVGLETNYENARFYAERAYKLLEQADNRNQSFLLPPFSR